VEFCQNLTKRAYDGFDKIDKVGRAHAILFKFNGIFGGGNLWGNLWGESLGGIFGGIYFHNSFLIASLLGNVTSGKAVFIRLATFS
jgi:hypothetical protein